MRRMRAARETFNLNHSGTYAGERRREGYTWIPVAADTADAP